MYFTTFNKHFKFSIILGMRNNDLSKSVLVVKNWFFKNNFEINIVWLDETARTAKEASERLNCEIAEIAKSLVFKVKKSNEAVLVVASGVNYVNEEKISKYLGEEIERPDANFVKETTGFTIGGIPPVAHKTKMKIFLDEDLFQFKNVWAAAGHPHAVFKTTAKDLEKMTNGKVVSVK